MQSVVEYDILPMLSEYWFDEPAKIQKWQNISGLHNEKFISSGRYAE